MTYYEAVVDGRSQIEREMEVVAGFKEMVAFMMGPDKATLSRLIGFFSTPKKPLLPRELKRFWDSLTESEKNGYRRMVVLREI